MDELLQSHECTALALVVAEHFFDFLFIVTGYGIRDDMNREATFSHIKDGGFHTGCGIRSGDIEFVNSVTFDK